MYNKSILFINPPSPFLEDPLVMPPLGIMYLSSYLKSKGINTNIYDASITNNKIPKSEITAFTSTTPQYNYTLNLLKNIKHETVKVIGGPHASSFMNCLDDNFNVSISGEGEIVLESLCNTEFTKNSYMSGIPINNINTLPFPDRDWDGFKKYKYKINDYNFTTAMTSRGCPYKCNFCFNIFGNKVRFMSPDKVLEEAKLIKNHYGFDGVMYYDDTFTININRVKKIIKGLKNIDLKFRCFVRANTVNYEILKMLKDNGCVEVGMGAESGSQYILNSMNKQVNVEQTKNVIKICNKIGLRIKPFFMVGYPGENIETINMTKEFIRDTKPPDFNITIYTPFPGTQVWSEYHKKDSKLYIEFKEPIDYNKMFYKSVEGRYSSNVRTSNLSYEDIEISRSEIESLKDYIKGCY